MGLTLQQTAGKTGGNAALSAELTRIGLLLVRAAEPQGAPDLPPRRKGPIAALGLRLGLTPFEADTLALAIGVELNGEIAALAARVAGDPKAGFASFALALAALEAPDWGATAPDRPLRRLRLVELSTPARLLASELRVDERVLHALLAPGPRPGQGLDARLAPYFRAPGDLPAGSEGLRAQVEPMVALIAAGDVPVLALTGRHRDDMRIAAARAVGARPLRRLDLASLPAAPAERESLARLWEREARLTGSALLIETGESADAAALADLIEGQPGPILVAGRQQPFLAPTVPVFHLHPPDRREQAGLWRRALGRRARSAGSGIDGLTQTFDLSETEIGAIAATIPPGRPIRAQDLWQTCRRSARLRLGSLALPIDARAGWEDLILPPDAMLSLKTLVAQVRHRHRVYQDWGFGARSNRGLGITALFAGPSGTGKTMAAEVLANALDLDLYRIDLSAVVSKYIGETEKNLGTLFDAAEGTGAILLFDEADALFGKRSEVGDAHDRYANIEVSYLLQRMEAYSGLAILTTNMRAALDDAFARRIRFAVTFPFPNYEARLRIWRCVFPPEAALGALAWEKLARLELTAGHIRNVAVNAAFLAADAARPIDMSHLLASAMIECANIEKPVTPGEVAGWSA